MGAYFYFHNRNTGEESSIGLKCNGGLSWAANFDMYSEEEQIEVFEEVIKGNGWSTDEVEAAGDNWTTFVYGWMDGKREIVVEEIDEDDEDDELL